MSALQAALGDYLCLRRGLGHKLDDSGRQLAKFVSYLDDLDAETVSLEAALAFVLDPRLDPASSVPSRRLTAVRGFARFLSGVDARTEIPPAGLVLYRPRRRNPYRFSEEDVAAVMRCARSSTPSAFRAGTLATLIGLLSVSGMRVGEALKLDSSDIDWDNAVVHVREAKFRKGRDVPVSASTIEGLAGYARHRDQKRLETTRFFVSLAGTPVIYTNFQVAWRKAVHAAGIGKGSSSLPRLHDLGGIIAVNNLRSWFERGDDVGGLLPVLQAYMGHSSPDDTAYYLRLTAESYPHITAQVQRAFGDVVPPLTAGPCRGD